MAKIRFGIGKNCFNCHKEITIAINKKIPLCNDKRYYPKENTYEDRSLSSYQELAEGYAYIDILRLHGMYGNYRPICSNCVTLWIHCETFNDGSICDDYDFIEKRIDISIPDEFRKNTPATF